MSTRVIKIPEIYYICGKEKLMRKNTALGLSRTIFPGTVLVTEEQVDQVAIK